MSGLTKSAFQIRTDALCPPPRTRYRNRCTRRFYLLIADDGAQCELQGIDRRSTYASHEALANHEIWERIP